MGDDYFRKSIIKSVKDRPRRVDKDQSFVFLYNYCTIQPLRFKNY